MGSNKAETPAMKEKSIKVGEDVLQEEEVLSMLKNAEKGKRVGTEYKQWEPGEVVRAVYLGMKTIPGKYENKGDDIEAALFLDENGNKFLTASTVLVEEIKNYEAPAMFEITCQEEKKTDIGSYFSFSVVELNPKG